MEVTFDIDANGVLHVSAKDLGTGKEQKITITASSGLTKEEIERMRKDADAHAEEDKKRREEIEKRNEADATLYRSEKMLKENESKISEADRAKIQQAIDALKEALKGSDVAALGAATDKLNETWQAVSAELYKAAAEQAQAGQAAGGPAGAAGASGASGAAGAAGNAGGESAGGQASDKDGPIIDAEVVDEEKK
jgi:molecular chaperone DnaK